MRAKASRYRPARRGEASALKTPYFHRYSLPQNYRQAVSQRNTILTLAGTGLSNDSFLSGLIGFEGLTVRYFDLPP
jgi:hypothetical protein